MGGSHGQHDSHSGGEKLLNLKVKVWRQKGPQSTGQFADYDLKGISTEMSFLEMMDVLNQQIIKQGGDPVAFDHDCREGICGSCNMVINGDPHGPEKGTTTCQLHMRRFSDGDTIVVEPWRAQAFPILKDLVVDRSAFDRIIAKGGFISTNCGNAPDGNALPVGSEIAELAMDAAACIGCGACVAACKNASAMLFVAAKVSHLVLLPQGQAERERRVLNMVEQMDAEGFGNCTNTAACSAACPKEIGQDNIARMNREYAKALVK